MGNLFLLIIKAIVGFSSHSQAMIADAANSAGDIFASIMAFIGNKIASEPQDETHNFGHGKAEYIFSLFISLSMLLVAFKLLWDSVYSIIYGSEIQFSWMLVVVCMITIATKLALFLYTHYLLQKQYNILLEANSKDHRNDCIVTSFTLLSIVLSLFGITWLDGIVGLGISLWIAYTGIIIFMDSYNILMDQSIDEKTKKLILDLVENYPSIQKTDHFSSTPVGYQYLISLTIFVDGNMSTFDSHAIADLLEKDITALDQVYLAIIHVNPI